MDNFSTSEPAREPSREPEREISREPVRIDRESFRVRLNKLKRGIVISWIVNFVLLALTIEAAIVFIFLQTTSSNAEIVGFLLLTVPVAVIVAAIAMALMSARSWKGIILELGTIEVDPATTRLLENIVEEMSLAAGIPQSEFPQIGVIPNDEPNAFALAGKDGSMVGVTTGLLRLLTREELQAVIAHEVGHLLTGDTKAMTKLIAMSSIVGIMSGIATRIFGFRGGDNKNPLAIALVVLSLIFLIAAPFLSQLANASMQRKRESQADATAVKLTRNPDALATALRKIDGAYSSVAYPKKKGSVDHAAKQLAFFSRNAYRTHPPIEERVHELKRMGADPSI